MKWPFERLRATLNSEGSSMLKLTSRFVLEVLPYLLSALAAAVLLPGLIYSMITVALPGVFYSEAHGTEAIMASVSGRGENALELIRRDYEAFAPNQMLLHGLAKTAEDNLVNR
jgi:hypothetical protein